MSEFIIAPGHETVLMPPYHQCQFLKNNWHIRETCTSDHLKQVIERINARKALKLKYSISDNRVLTDAGRLRLILTSGDFHKYVGILFDDKLNMILDPYY